MMYITGVVCEKIYRCTFVRVSGGGEVFVRQQTADSRARDTVN